MFADAVLEYICNEIKLGAMIGPFTIPPFLGRIGVSPLSTRQKHESNWCRIILDLSWLLGRLVNDSISKEWYCGDMITLSYPTVDDLVRRIAHLGEGCLLWKKDLSRFFRQIPLCPHDISLIGYR